MAATAEQIKKLRELTGAGVLESKRILEEHNGNFDAALDILKAKSVERAAKKADREVKSGLIDSYIHGGKVGVLLELSCETDFVARNEVFKTLSHELALQIVATNPKYVSSAEMPPEAQAEVRTLFEKEARAEGKPDALVARIVEGKLNKYYKENCLIQQPFIKDDSTTIHDLIQAAISKLGENILVRRFVRFELGQ